MKNNNDYKLSKENIETKRIHDKLIDLVNNGLAKDFNAKYSKKVFQCNLNEYKVNIIYNYCKEKEINFSRILQLIINDWWEKDEFDDKNKIKELENDIEVLTKYIKVNETNK